MHYRIGPADDDDSRRPYLDKIFYTTPLRKETQDFGAHSVMFYSNWENFDMGYQLEIYLGIPKEWFIF